MERKKWTPKTEITTELLEFREKRKWQIALRRYILEKQPSHRYAPYFGLDILNLRSWIESQFSTSMNWDNFASLWQFEQVLPAQYFNLQEEEELRLCWNFLNLKVETLQNTDKQGKILNFPVMYAYFEEIFKVTEDLIAQKLMQKVKQVNKKLKLRITDPQIKFLQDHHPYIKSLASFGPYEYELLNQGLTPSEIQQQMTEMKKIKF